MQMKCATTDCAAELRPWGAPSAVLLHVTPELFIREWRQIERDEGGEETHWTALWLESEQAPMAQLNHIAHHGNKTAVASADGAWVAADDRTCVRITSADGTQAFSALGYGVAAWQPGWAIHVDAAGGPALLLRPGWVPYLLTAESRLLQ